MGTDSNGKPDDFTKLNRRTDEYACNFYGLYLKNCWLECFPGVRGKNFPLKLIMTATWENYILYTNWNISLFSPPEPFWNAKVGSQETPEVTGTFGLGVQNEAGQRLKSSAKRMHWL